MATKIKCLCGDVELKFSGEPMAQVCCHCEDCPITKAFRRRLAAATKWLTGKGVVAVAELLNAHGGKSPFLPPTYSSQLVLVKWSSSTGPAS